MGLADMSIASGTMAQKRVVNFERSFEVTPFPALFDCAKLMTDPEQAIPDSESKRQPFSVLRTLKVILLPIALGFLLSFFVIVGQWFQGDSAKYFLLALDGMRMQIVIAFAAITTIGFTVWMLRPSRRMVMIGLALMVCLIGILSCFVRLDGFNGDRTPRLAWRWSLPAESKVKSYLISKKASPLPRISPELSLATPTDFPGFMGQERNAVLNSISLGDHWELVPPKLLWKHPVGLGWSSFALVGELAVDLEQRDQDECIVCYHATTGEELWCHREVERFTSEHGDGPRSTPTIHQGRVYSMGGCGRLTCVDLMSGELIWKQTLLDGPGVSNLYFGTTSSPLIVGDLVVVTPGAGEGGSAVAFSAETGEERWRCGDDHASYASPIASSLCQVPQILSFNGAGLRSYSIDGKSLFLHPWVTQGDSRVNVAQPVIVDQCDDPTRMDQGARVLISSGYDMGTALLKITNEGGVWATEEIWRSSHLKSKLSNFVVLDQHLYGLDNGLLTCLRLEDGKRVWKKGRYGHGQMLLVRDKLLIQAESGEIVLVAATPESHRELTRFTALSGKTWNHPSLAGNRLVIRNDSEAAAYEMPCE
jgi:outer membrane protein assembly factor BamB